MQSQDVKDEIVAALKRSKEISRTILFGSYAKGTQTEDSDVDLVVVLNKKGFSSSYSEMLQNRLSVTCKLESLQEKVPVDTLVYTKDEWDAATRIRNDFMREIQENGVVLI